MNPEYFEAHIEKAVLLILDGDLESAKSSLDEALSYAQSSEEKNIVETITKKYRILLC
jgi:DNA polymerase III delta prime subunit